MVHQRSMVRRVYGTNSLWYELSIHMVQIVNGTHARSVTYPFPFTPLRYSSPEIRHQWVSGICKSYFECDNKCWMYRSGGTRNAKILSLWWHRECSFTYGIIRRRL